MAPRKKADDSEVVTLDIKAEARKRGKRDNFGDKVKVHQRYYTDDGAMVPGATTILGNVPKPYLVGWANRLGLEGIDVNKYKDEAADSGSVAHHLVESYLRGVEPKLGNFTGDQIERGKLALAAFKQWREDEAPDLEVLGIEMRLVSQRHRFGGTIDLYAKMRGRFAIVDYKTSASVYLEHKAQVTAYVRMAQENDLRVQDAIIVQLPRTEGGTYESHRLKPEHMSLYWRLFEQAAGMHSLLKEIRAAGAA